MNTSAKGARLERRSRALLESEGYEVIRAAASKGPFDLVGISSAGLTLVQVRANRWPSPAETSALRAFLAPPGTRKLVHRWVDRVGVPDVREVTP